MRLRYTVEAQRDLADIARHIALDRPSVAQAMLARIEEHCRGLESLPQQGRRAGSNRRELVIAGTPTWPSTALPATKS